MYALAVRLSSKSLPPLYPRGYSSNCVRGAGSGETDSMTPAATSRAWFCDSWGPSLDANVLPVGAGRCTTSSRDMRPPFVVLEYGQPPCEGGSSDRGKPWLYAGTMAQQLPLDGPSTVIARIQGLPLRHIQASQSPHKMTEGRPPSGYTRSLGNHSWGVVGDAHGL